MIQQNTGHVADPTSKRNLPPFGCFVKGYHRIFIQTKVHLGRKDVIIIPDNCCKLGNCPGQYVYMLTLLIKKNRRIETQAT